MNVPSPRRLFTVLATAEAVTWTLLLVGMFLKYVTKTTDAVVSVGGMLHGIVFIAYVLGTVLVWIDGRWRAKYGVIALVTAIPPLATLWTEWWLGKADLPASRWRLAPSGETPRSLPERLVAGLLARPLRALVIGVVAVAALTGLALLVGPPTSGGH